MSTTTQILNLQSRLEQLGINSQISGSPSSGMYIKTLSIDFDDNSYVMVTYGFDGIEQFQLLYGTKNLDTQVFSFSTIEQTINFIQNLKK